MKIAEIELRKIANVLVYFANSTESFGVIKANKLLYYLDCLHLLKYGRAVLKDKYVKMPFGPVPLETYNRLRVIRDITDYLPEEYKQELDSVYSLMLEYIDIVSKPLYNRTIDQIIAQKEFEPKWFSKSEIAIMKEVAEKYHNTTATELVRATHEEAPYKETDMHDIVDLKLFLKDHNVSQEYIEEVTRTESLIDAISANYQ